MSDDYLKKRLDLKNHGKPPKEKKVRKIKPISDKTAKRNRVLAAAYEIFLEQHPLCEVRGPECTNVSTQVHHKLGRGDDVILDQTTWLATCWHCNVVYVEEKHAEAIERGYKEKRNTQTKRYKNTYKNGDR